MRTPRTGARALLVVACALVALGAPDSASAATFCVPAHGPACSGTDKPTIQAAIQAAAANNVPRFRSHDTIHVAAGTYGGPSTDSAGNPLTLIGTGDKTVLAAPSFGPGSTTLTVDEPASSVESLKVLAPPEPSQTALSGRGTFTHVSIAESPGNSGATGVYLTGGTFDQGTVSLGDSLSRGVVGTDGSVTRSRITAGSVGIWDVRDLSALDDLVRVTASGGTALKVQGSGSPQGLFSATHFSGRQLTLAGPATSPATGVDVEASPPNGEYGGDGSAVLDGVLLQGFTSDLEVNGLTTGCGASPDQTPCTFHSTLSISYSDFDPSKAHHDGLGTITEGSGNLHAVDPLFADPAAGNFDLRHTSPAIDKGNPQAPATGEPATDVLGRPRKVDGNDDGAAVADMGAFESQVPPPVAVIRAPSLVLVGRPVRFDGSSSHDPGRGTLTYLWQFGDGNESTAVRPLHTFRHPGTYRVRLTITSSSGAPAGSTSRRIVVSRSPLCVVPGLRGKTLAAARRALRRAHCRLGHVTRQRSSAVRRGRVIGSRPGRRTRLVRDARVALTLSRGRR